MVIESETHFSSEVGDPVGDPVGNLVGDPVGNLVGGGFVQLTSHSSFDFPPTGSALQVYVAESQLYLARGMHELSQSSLSTPRGPEVQVYVASSHVYWSGATPQELSHSSFDCPLRGSSLQVLVSSSHEYLSSGVLPQLASQSDCGSPPNCVCLHCCDPESHSYLPQFALQVAKSLPIVLLVQVMVLTSHVYRSPALHAVSQESSSG